MRVASSFAFALAAIFISSQTPAGAQVISPYPSAAQGAFASSPFGPFRTAGRSRGSNSSSRGCLTSDTRRVLSGLEARFGAVKVISTCRPGARIAGTGRPSQHGFGRAVDFMPRPGQRGAMIAWLRANAGGAVITYGSGHLHFDTGGYRVFASGKVRRAYASAQSRRAHMRRR